MVKVYMYKGCDTCRKARKWLVEAGVEFQELAIRETPPTARELGEGLSGVDGAMRRLFNVSGQDYRKLGLKDRLPEMSEEEAFELLADNGNLVKRPFLVSPKGNYPGFDGTAWRQLLA